MNKSHETEETFTTEDFLNLRKRVYDLEVQMTACLRFIRYRAEQEAKEKDPSFKAHGYDKA